jgi:tetratricopeptide (TPR) repeat protein
LTTDFRRTVSKSLITMPSRRLVRIGIVLLASVSVSCASRRPVTTVPASPSVRPTREIEALIERGCLRCLERALTMSREHNVSQLAFEAAALLVLRGGELGIPAQGWMQQARELAAGDATRERYLEMVASVPPDPLSGLRGDLLIESGRRNRAQSLLPAWRESLHTSSASSPFRLYLDLSLTCLTDFSADRDRILDEAIAALPDVPLLRFRAAICDRRYRAENVTTLTMIEQRDEDFADVNYALGRYAMQDPKSPDQDEALRRFKRAAAAFPASVAVTLTIGNLYQSWEDWPNALAAYDSVLALMPAHPEALLGRTISLSNLERNQDAIVAATTLIDGGRWYLGQAHYWRAWNQFNLGHNDAARADADRTRTLMVNASVFLLSGLIEWRAPRLPSAEKEFEQAIAMDFGQCLAALYLGGVRSEQGKPVESIAALKQARQCFELSITVHRAAIEKIDAGPGTPAGKARGVSREERLIADAERRRDQAVRTIDALQKRIGPAQ